MAHQEEYSVIQNVFKLLADEGFGALGEALRMTLNQAMMLEREQHLGAGAYKRIDWARSWWRFKKCNTSEFTPLTIMPMQ